MKTFLVTTAVNQAALHRGFWASLQQCSNHTGAEIVVVGAVYRNPSAMKKRERSDDVYATELHPYLTRKRRVLGPNLTLFADVPCQPTASNPTSGLEVLCAGSSAILGHVKRQLQVVPTARRVPRCIWTTGACTVAAYSKSRAGARAKEHHVLGALVVEVCRGGTYFVRNVTANPDGSFTDLDTRYSPSGVEKAPRALSVVLGDVHVGQEAADATAAARALVEAVAPQHLVLHDVFDGHTRSHHRQGKKDRFASASARVKDEVRATALALSDFSGWAPDMATHVIQSNHHDHLDRWLQEHDLEADPVNNPYFHELWASLYRSFEESGRQWPNTLQLACEEANGGPIAGVQWPSRTDPVKIGGVIHGLHGDVGSAGSRGSLRGFSRMGCKVTVGHSHTPGILDGVFQTGVLGRIDMDYAMRGPTTWLHAHVVLGADGKRQMVITQGKKYRGKS